MMGREVVIIGGGLAGLSCGVMLSRMGWHVTVLEQQHQIGGCLQTFCRRGVRFETGMHFVGSLDPGQVLQPYAHFLGIDRDVRYGRLDTKAYNIIALAGKRFDIANGREAFIDSLGHQLGGCADQLAAYHDLVHLVARNTPIATVGAQETDTMLFARYQMEAMDTVIDSVVSDERLRHILVGHLSLFQGMKGRTPFTSHAFITDFYDASAFRVIGGASHMADAMAKVIRGHGGEVLTHHRAQAITVDGGKVSGVVAEDKLFACDAVVSTIHPSHTMSLLPPLPGILRPAFLRRVATIPNTTGVFAIYLHFKRQSLPYMNSNFFSYPDGNPWGCEEYDDTQWPRGYLYMHHQSEECQQWADTGVILSYMRYDEVEKWRGTAVGQRGEEYEDFKLRHAERLLDVVERDFPGLRSHLEHIYTSTPLTYEDYNSTPQGCIYGTVKDVTSLAEGHVSHTTRLPGLYLAGQSINSHGMLGTIVGSVIACGSIVGENNLYNAIRNEI